MPTTSSQYCPQCKAVVATKEVGQYHYPDPESYLLSGEDVDAYTQLGYDFSVCVQCNQVFLESTTHFVIADTSTVEQERQLLYPAERVPTKVPPRISTAYHEARTALQAGLVEATVIMCRKCVEGICAERGASGKTLASSLSELRSSGAIDETLYRWANELRLAGNDAAHDFETSLTRDDAKDSMEFLEALLTYILGFPRFGGHFSKLLSA